MESIRPARLGTLAALGILLVAASCDKSPTGPPPLLPTTGVVRLELEAPAEIPPGESVQLTANGVKSNGSVENLTSRALWTTPSSSVLQLSSSGLATGKSRGEAFVTVRHGGLAAGARILVLPHGTFRLSGTIREGADAVPGASVSVISGVGEGLTATTDLGGNYALYGISGTVRIQIRREGYLESIHQVSAVAHRTLDFEMVPERPRSDYRGTYRLTITAAPRCTSLPESAKKRQYTADVAQDGARLTVTLRGADFTLVNGRGNSFAGTVDIVGTVRFTIGEVYLYYDYYVASLFDIAERVDTYLVLTAGIVSAQGTPTLVSGKLNGSISVASSSTPPFGFSTWCGSTVHEFEMVRQ